jgi:hypothetical protein
MKYRKRPVIVEAIEWDGEKYTFDRIEKWSGNLINWFTDRGGNMVLLIPTLEGEMKALKGDFIIKEPFPTEDRQFYPCKPAIFEATYEPME